MPPTSNRLIGIDFTYMMALVGCVIYIYVFTMGDMLQNALTHSSFNAILDIFPALFFFLNGFTVTLTMRDRRISNRKLLAYLGKRGSVLFLVGLACCAWWPMNIFIASGLMYVLAPFVAQWNTVLLRVITLLTLLVGMVMLYIDVPSYTVYHLPTLEGGEIYNILGFVLFNGYFSVLPWFAFFFAGLLYGRTEIKPRGIFPPSSMLGLAFIVASYVVNVYAKGIDNDVGSVERSDIFILNMRLLFPSFIFYGIGICIIVANAFIFLFRQIPNGRLLKTVQAISAMKYSVLFIHLVIGSITLSSANLPFFSKRIILFIYVVIASFMTFYLTLLWRRRVNEQGPMEWLIKRISGSAKK